MNDLDLGLWIMKKRLSRSSVALLKRRVSYLKNNLDLGLWIMQKRLSTSSVALLQIRVCKNVLAEVV